MKFCLMLALLALAAPARGAEIDMNTQTCQDWLDADEDEQDLMTAWLRGYVAGRNITSTLDLSRMRDDVAKLKSYCQAHTTVSVMSAATQGRK